MRLPTLLTILILICTGGLLLAADAPEAPPPLAAHTVDADALQGTDLTADLATLYGEFMACDALTKPSDLTPCEMAGRKFLRRIKPKEHGALRKLAANCRRETNLRTTLLVFRMRPLDGNAPKPPRAPDVRRVCGDFVSALLRS